MPAADSVATHAGKELLARTSGPNGRNWPHSVAQAASTRRSMSSATEPDGGGFGAWARAVSRS